jgi:hypothetical protein
MRFNFYSRLQIGIQLIITLMTSTNNIWKSVTLRISLIPTTDHFVIPGNHRLVMLGLCI